MAASFPTTIKAYADKTNADTVEAAHINSPQEEIAALEAKVGVDSSAVSTSHDYILNNKIWPIGSVFLSVVATNPGTLIGFGTWSQIAGGKMLVGQTDGDSDFNVAEETGGDKTKTIAKANLPNISTGTGTAHTHIQNSHTHAEPTYDQDGHEGHIRDGNAAGDADSVTINAATATNQNESAHTHSLGGSGTAMDVVNPYIVIFCWKRTA